MWIQKKTLRLDKLLACRFAIMTFAGVLAYLPTGSQAELQMLDQVVAIVEDGVITHSEVAEQIQVATQNMIARNVALPPAQELKEQVLNHLILESIQMQMGARAGVRITDNTLTESMIDIANRNQMNLEQFKESLENEGLSYQDTREQIRREMIINRVQQGNLNSRIQVTDQEIDNFLNSVEGQQLTDPTLHLQHILLPVSSKASDKQRAKKKQIMAHLQAAIKSGKTSFDEINKNGYQGNKLQTSDLGWRKSADIPSIFADIAPNLSLNQVSNPIPSASGWHLIKLIGKRGGTGQMVRQTQARHILVKPSAIRSNSQAKEFITNLRDRIINGEEFIKLAKQFSEDPGSALQGGDLGWANPGQFVPIFEQTMDQLGDNEISSPFESQYGWHILQVLDRRNQDISQLRWKSQAQRTIHQRKFNEELQAWLLKIRDEAFVEFK